jgi:hypothetical protein
MANPSARSRHSAMSRGTPMTNDSSEQFTRNVRTPCARSTVRTVERGASTRRRPVVTARTCRMRAAGTHSTTLPARFARQPKSMSSRSKEIAGSNPPSRSHSSRRTSIPADGTASTSVLCANSWPRPSLLQSNSDGPMPVCR